MILFLVRWKCFPSIGVAGGDISRLQLVLSKTPLSKLIRGCEKYLLEKIIQLVAELSEQMPRCRPQERLTIPRSLFHVFRWQRNLSVHDTVLASLDSAGSFKEKWGDGSQGCRSCEWDGGVGCRRSDLKLE